MREVEAGVPREELSVDFVQMPQGKTHRKARKHLCRLLTCPLIHIHSFLYARCKYLYLMLGRQFLVLGIHQRTQKKQINACFSEAKGWQTELNLINTYIIVYVGRW